MELSKRCTGMSWYLLILLGEYFFYVEFLIFLNNSLQESITRLSSFQGIRPILSVNEVDLKRNLLDPAVFDKTVRPRINTSHTVNVQIGVTSVFVTDLVSTLPKLWF